MRHLGIVQKKGMMGNLIELQTFAREEGEFIWRVSKKSIPAEKPIADRLNRFAPGTMVMAEVNDAHVIQRVDDAEDQILALLQGFGRQLESYKNQAQEIETWRESLQYQAEALGTREQEWQNREHELLTEIAQLRAHGNGGYANPEQEVELVNLREQMRLERVQFEEDCFRLTQNQRPALDLGGLLSELSDQVQAQTNQQQIFQEALQQLLYTIEYTLSELVPMFDLIQLDLVQCDQEQSELNQRHQALEAHFLRYQQQQGQQAWLPQIQAALTQLSQLITRCGGESQPIALSPAELEQRRRRLSDQQRDYLQRAHQVLQQDEELRLQQTQQDELNQQIQSLRDADGDPDTLADLEDELEFSRQACNELKESLTRQKSRLAQDEAHLNEDRLIVAQFLEQQEGHPQGPHPFAELIPDLSQILNHLQALPGLEDHTEAYPVELLEREQIQQDQIALAVKRACLSVELRSLEERRQFLTSQQAILAPLHTLENAPNPQMVIDHLNAQLTTPA